MLSAVTRVGGIPVNIKYFALPQFGYTKLTCNYNAIAWVSFGLDVYILPTLKLQRLAWIR